MLTSSHPVVSALPDHGQREDVASRRQMWLKSELSTAAV